MKFNTTKSGEIVSEEEQYFMDELNKLNISYKYRYFDEVNYPYDCDFYLDQFNIYVELNTSLLHNTHFYDATCLGNTLIVRDAVDGEHLKTLDGRIVLM